jgi:hypothetical protein
LSSRIYKIFFATLCFLVFNAGQLSGQSGNTTILGQLKLSQALDPPQDILSSKSIVIVSAPRELGSGVWKQRATEMQAYFGEVGIDAVAYFNLDRKFSIPDVESDIPKLIKDRNVTNLIFLIIGEEGEESVIGFGPYNGKSTMYDQGATFWVRTFTDLETVFDEMSLLFKTGAFPRTNLLVNDQPEFFDFTGPSFAANYASFPPELTQKVIGIPTLQSQSDNAGAHLMVADDLHHPQVPATRTRDRNNALQAVLMDSLMDMRQIDRSSRTEALLRRDGVTHILYYAEGDSEFMYDLFTYKNREEVAAPYLVKFFLKDLRNSNIFLGRTWDARADWQSALDSFLAQIEQELAKQAD